MEMMGTAHCKLGEEDQMQRQIAPKMAVNQQKLFLDTTQPSPVIEISSLQIEHRGRLMRLE